MPSAIANPPQDDLAEMLAEIEEQRPGQARIVAEVTGSSTAAAELRRMRGELGMTKKELAAAAGLKQGQLSRYENPNYRGQKLSTLARIVESVGWHWRFQAEPSDAAFRSLVRFDGTLARLRATYTAATVAAPPKLEVVTHVVTGKFELSA